jgi:outer membrane protein
MRIKNTAFSPPRTYRSCRPMIVLIALSVVICCACTFSPHRNDEAIRDGYARQVAFDPDPEALSALASPGVQRASQNGKNGTLPATLTLAKAIEIATENNPDRVQAHWRIEQARAMRAMADAAFWPQLSVYTEYMQGDAPSAYLFKKIDQRMLPPDVNFNDPGWFRNFESGLRGEMNLFNGFRDHLAMQAAQMDVEISRSSHTQVLNDLTAEVIKTYYDALAARDFIGIAQASVETAAEQLRIVRVHYEGGAVFKSDVLSLEVRLAEAQEQLVSSRIRSRLARAALAHLMGHDPALLAGDAQSEAEIDAQSGADIDAQTEAGLDARIEAEIDSPTDTIQLMETTWRPVIPEHYEQGLVLAMAQRPELLQAHRQVEKTRYGLFAARGAYLPRLDLMAAYYLNDPSMDYNLDRDNWTAALLLTWDIFSGFSRSAGVDRARAMLRQMSAAERQAILQVQLDVKRSYLNLNEAVARHAVAERSKRSAEESFRMVREHYQGGAVPISRYLEAELDRNRTRIRSTAAYYDQMKANAEVARAIGLWAWEKPEIEE